MNKVEKGTPGYLEYKKKAEMVRTLIYFGISAAIFILGYIQTKSKLNLMTVFAMLGCLPSSKALVGVIARFPYKSIPTIHGDEIKSRTKNLTVIYDLIITSREKIMPVECMVISGNSIYGYTENDKVDLNYAATHIRGILNENHFPDVSVKLLNNYSAFLARAEGLNSIAGIEKSETKELEEKMKFIILCISM